MEFHRAARAAGTCRLSQRILAARCVASSTTPHVARTRPASMPAISARRSIQMRQGCSGAPSRSIAMQPSSWPAKPNALRLPACAGLCSKRRRWRDPAPSSHSTGSCSAHPACGKLGLIGDRMLAHDSHLRRQYDRFQALRADIDADDHAARPAFPCSATRNSTCASTKARASASSGF